MTANEGKHTWKKIKHILYCVSRLLATVNFRVADISAPMSPVPKKILILRPGQIPLISAL